MNNIDFAQTGGFPLTQDALDFLQKAYQNPFGGLAKFISNNALCVLDGCIVSGNAMSSGWVAYNGEIMPFSGGTVQATFLIRDVPTNLTYQDGMPHGVVHDRFAQFGVGAGAITWNPARLVTPLFTALINSENHIATGGHDWTKITNTPFKHSGTINVGNLNSPPNYPDETFLTVNIPNIQPPYMVVGSLVANHGNNLDLDDAVTFTVSNKTLNAFQVAFRNNNPNVSGNNVSVTFDYIIIKF